MTAKKKILIISAAVLAVSLCLQVVVLSFLQKDLENKSSQVISKLRRSDSEKILFETKAIANTLATHLEAVESVVDESMLNAAIALQELDKSSNLSLADLLNLLKNLEVSALYLIDEKGNFLLSTVPQTMKAGLNLFDIWNGYQDLINGGATRIPSTIKIMAENGEIYKFIAIPRYDSNGKIKGIIESASEVSSIESTMRSILESYPNIVSFHLFNTDGVCLMSIENENAKFKYRKQSVIKSKIAKNVLSSGIENFYDNGSALEYYSVISRPKIFTNTSYKVMDGTAYLMSVEVDKKYYQEATLRTESLFGEMRDSFLNLFILTLIIGLISAVAIVLCNVFAIGKYLIDPLEVQSSTDALTKIANRRYFDINLTREWGAACRNSQCLSLIMIDIDFFKKVNDNYGHKVGDKVLSLVAGLIKNNAKRSTDCAARYGGEEFAIILANTNLKAARSIAERIRIEAEKLSIDLGKKNISITLSAGITSVFPSKYEGTQDDFVKSADKQLYQAKNNGRNRVEG